MTDTLSCKRCGAIVRRKRLAQKYLFESLRQRGDKAA
jgi:hypothetical protein